MTFTTSRPLRFGDCDPSGIAYFPSYLNILAGVMEEFFEAAGVPWLHMLREQRITTPTKKLDLTFVAPGFHGDLLEFTVYVRAVGRTSLTFEHQVRTDGRLLWSARHVVVVASMVTSKAVPWPEAARAALLRCLETAEVTGA